MGQRLSVVVISYPHVTTGNIASLRRAAEARELLLQEWQPHEITIWCGAGPPVPLYRDESIQPDALLHRTISRLTGIVVPALLLWRDRGAVIPNDPARALLARDKLATALELSRVGLPFVPTLGFYTSNTVSLGPCGSGPVVVKPAHGLQGRDVVFFPEVSAAEGVQRQVPWQEPMPFSFEHFVAQPVVGRPGQDIRAYVVDGRCVGLVRRRASIDSERRANLAVGGRATPLELDHPAADLSVATTMALGLDYAGVDMVEGEEGQPLVLEADAWAGFVGMEEAAGVDIAGASLDMVIARMAKRS